MLLSSSYSCPSSLSNIIDMAREITENGTKDQLEKLAKLMQCHESQQSAAIVATIAILIGNTVDTDGMNIVKDVERH